MEATTGTAVGAMETAVREAMEQETQGIAPGIAQGTTIMESVMEPVDRVRANTSAEVNRQIDRETDVHVRAYAQMGGEEIARRIHELDREWDMERILETNASALALTGVFFGLLGSKKWLIISGAVLAFLFQHASQGWCPPVPLLRRLGVRTRKEIDQEKYALKALRGDFALNESLPIAEAALQSVKY